VGFHIIMNGESRKILKGESWEDLDENEGGESRMIIKGG
jgi:hypothetical protein